MSTQEDQSLSPLMRQVLELLGRRVIDHHAFRGDDTVTVVREDLLESAQMLRERLGFDFLVDVTAVDYFGQPDFFSVHPEVWDSATQPVRRIPESRHHVNLPPRGTQPRFAVVYHLLATSTMARLRIKCRVPEADPAIDSVVGVWPGANWLERETYDLYGIDFRGHPDLRRIYLYDEFVGHPLRKDYDKRHEQPIEPYAGPQANHPRRPQ
ncbi:MAG TPA: NADH-quinone oxidoreductase subunit C [Candidatus Binataceae bacterium]|nr:NADH-quinone oxidoreductase subunit C [Candidatus Binataceae bacterium]